MYELYDMHCHLDDFDQPAVVARELAARGIGVLAVTTTPRQFRDAHADLSGFENVILAPGLHPWWFDDNRFDPNHIDDLLALVPENRFIGEIGLDFYERHAPQSTWAAQRHALLRILQACSEESDPAHPHVLSIHSVRAATEVLDLLEQTGAHERCSCIFHWFSGSTDELWRAIHMGCWFSVGSRSLATGKGREYLKLIPRDRLLFETDTPWPGDAERGYNAIHESLIRAEEAASAIIGAEAVAQVACNAAQILEMG